MRRRSKIILVLYLIALFAVLVTALISCNIGAGNYTARIDAYSTRAFGETMDAVTRLEESLYKIPLAKELSIQTAILSDIYSAAQSTETALSMLPVELDALESVSHHINLIGDYAYTALGYTAAGTTIPDEAKKQMALFAETINDLTVQLNTLQQAMIDRAVIPEHFELLTDALHNVEKQSNSIENTLDNEFHEIAKRTPIPEALVYDGKFCSHSKNDAQINLQNKAVSQKDARLIAAEFLSVNPDQLIFDETVEGDIQCWRFKPESESSNTFLDISINGGKIVRFVSDGQGQAEIQHKAPEEILHQFGIEDVQLVKSTSVDSVETRMYAPVQDGVILLPDRIVIQTNRQAVILMDFTEYLMHHHKRELSAFQSEADLSSAVPNHFRIRDSKDVVICSSGGQERLCKKISGVTESGLNAVIFINQLTGKQEQIWLQTEIDRAF